jgi:hypothetical protein
MRLARSSAPDVRQLLSTNTATVRRRGPRGPVFSVPASAYHSLDIKRFAEFYRKEPALPFENTNLLQAEVPSSTNQAAITDWYWSILRTTVWAWENRCKDCEIDWKIEMPFGVLPVSISGDGLQSVKAVRGTFSSYLSFEWLIVVTINIIFSLFSFGPTGALLATIFSILAPNGAFISCIIPFATIHIIQAFLKPSEPLARMISRLTTAVLLILITFDLTSDSSFDSSQLSDIDPYSGGIWIFRALCGIEGEILFWFSAIFGAFILGGKEKPRGRFLLRTALIIFGFRLLPFGLFWLEDLPRPDFPAIAIRILCSCFFIAPLLAGFYEVVPLRVILS